MMLLAAEHGARLPRVTLDADVLVDVRATPAGLEVLADWLGTQRFIVQISAAGIGHRFTRPADPGPGTVMIDVLAPEGLGSRTRVFTVPPARTVSVPASGALLGAARPCAVVVRDTTGRQTRGSVQCPGVLAALIGKAAATTIAVRQNPEREVRRGRAAVTLLMRSLT